MFITFDTILIHFYVYFSALKISSSNYTLYSCEDVDNLGWKQHIFAKIGKYVIMALAAWNLLREVSICLEAKQNSFYVYCNPYFVLSLIVLLIMSLLCHDTMY